MDKVNETLERLKSEGYEVIEEFGVNDTMNFVFKQYRLRYMNVYTWTFVLAFVVLGMILGGLVIINHELSGEDYGLIFRHCAGAVKYSVWIFLLLIIPHELLHGLGFKMCGAKKLKYGAIWSSMAFYCAANDFVTDYKQYRFMGLLPNVVINAGLLIALVVVLIAGGTMFWQFLIFGTLFFHVTGGVGDMALIGYMYRHRKQGGITFDDLDVMRSYMLVRKERIC